MYRLENKFLCLSAVFIVLLWASPAELSAGESRWYVESKLGQADFDGTLGTQFLKVFDSSEGSVSVELGYSIHEYFAVQVGFHDLGSHQGFGVPCADNDEACVARFATLDDRSALCSDGAPCEALPLVLGSLTADVDGLSLAAVPRWPVTQRFMVYGKLGVIDWDADISESFENRPIETFSDRDLMTAIGLQYVFPKGLGLLAEYQELDFDVGSTSLGASWRF